MQVKQGSVKRVQEADEKSTVSHLPTQALVTPVQKPKRLLKKRESDTSVVPPQTFHSNKRKAESDHSKVDSYKPVSPLLTFVPEG